MATSLPSSDQAADLLKDLSLESETKTDEIQEPVKKLFTSEYGSSVLATNWPDHDIHLTCSSTFRQCSLMEGTYGENGNFMYNQGYGYVAYGGYSSGNPAVGHDGHQYGTQQYQYPGSFYHHQTSTGTYFPPNQASNPQGEVLNSANADKLPPSVGTGSGNPNNMVNTGNVNRNNGSKSFRPNNQYSSANSSGSFKKRGSQVGYMGHQDPRIGYEGFQSPYAWYDASMFANGSSTHATGGYSSLMNSHGTRDQATGYMNWMYPNARMYGQYGNGAPYGSYGWTNGRGWLVVDNKCKPRFRGYGNENMDGLSELNRGPRAKGSKNQEHIEGKNLPLTEDNKEETVSQILEKDQYNREDFAEEYSEAKFFVIKSYSEDDVHKSIKYGVWASTPNGNKKLDAAYTEAKAVSGGCPVFLLFSVNTSGQFVGLAEMVGPVDFNRTVEYWQQDKWTGCFPVKWHIVKDVPNSTLRHIILENNENKPVTNSRDTQEVVLEKGVQILKIFKSHKGKTSILDDFGFYAARERIMQEKRAKQKTQKQATDGKLSEDATDNKNEVATLDKESSVMANGNVKSPEQNGSIDTVENSPKGTNASPEKSVPNVVASAC